MAKVEIRFARDTLSPKLRDLARTFANRRPITRAMGQALQSVTVRAWRDDRYRILPSTAIFLAILIVTPCLLPSPASGIGKGPPITRQIGDWTVTTVYNRMTGKHDIEARLSSVYGGLTLWVIADQVSTRMEITGIGRRRVLDEVYYFETWTDDRGRMRITGPWNARARLSSSGRLRLRSPLSILRPLNEGKMLHFYVWTEDRNVPFSIDLDLPRFIGEGTDVVIDGFYRAGYRL